MRLPSLYRELAPPAFLARDLVCTWMQLIGAADHAQQVLPDACVDIVWVGEAPPVIVGPSTGMFIAPLPAGARVLGARFRPGMAPRLLGLPADALRDREVPLREAWGPAAERLSARLAEAPTPTRALQLVEEALARRLVQAGSADRLVQAAVAALARDPAARIEAISSAAGVSARQLRRRFEAMVGYGPKRLHRILRLQRALALAGDTPAAPAGLATLALRAGYADQAHMTREMTALAGRTPSALLPGAFSTLAMADLFKTTEDAAD